MKSRCIMEKTLKIPFAEINLVRVRCKQCGDAALEMPLAALVNGPLLCSGCGKDLRTTAANVVKALREVANGLTALQKHNDIEVQFVLPFDD